MSLTGQGFLNFKGGCHGDRTGNSTGLQECGWPGPGGCWLRWAPNSNQPLLPAAALPWTPAPTAVLCPRETAAQMGGAADAPTSTAPEQTPDP